MAERLHGSTDGFTLIEVIIAFLMLAMVLASTALSVSYSSRLYRRADEARAARGLAEQLVAEKLVRTPQQPEQESGTSDEIRWTIARKILSSHFGAGGGNLVSFDLDLRDRSGRLIDRYSSVYVEHSHE